MLVRVNDNGVCLTNRCVCPSSRILKRVGDQAEIAPVSSVNMYPESVSLAKRQDLLQRVDGAKGRSSQGGHDSPDIALTKLIFKSLKTHAPAVIGRYRRIIEPQDPGNPLVCVMRLFGTYDSLPAPFAASYLSGNPQSLKVGESSA